ncbi:MAG: RNA polymerase factor sigma-54 [Acidobacteriaceae bacterium]
MSHQPMTLLQPRLNLKVSQKQILTPGLVQMVSVLALNKIELKEMINNELTENPVLEELDTTVPILDDVDHQRDLEPPSEPTVSVETGEAKDPFDEIDFGSYFQDYLDPGYRNPIELEDPDRPSFEHFLSSPTTLIDHLMWQLGAMIMRDEVRTAAELIIGNLNEDGYLIASDEELLALTQHQPLPVEAIARSAADRPPERALQIVCFEGKEVVTLATLREALEIVRQMDPIGVAARTLRECLLAQLRNQHRIWQKHATPAAKHNGSAQAALNEEQVILDAIAIVDDHLQAIQAKQFREIARAISRPVAAVQTALDFVRTLDPKPGSRYNNNSARLIEPDVAFVKHGDEFLVVMNDDDLPTLRLNGSYRKLLNPGTSEKEVRNYVKERFKSAVQLIRNIEQRKQTILKVCYSIITRQGEFLERGLDHIAPMMIKDVAEEIGVHPSTVSRAVANKYVHTVQGVFELRYFFSESVGGPEGGATSLMVLKRRVGQLIEQEDPAKPLTDEQITQLLRTQGINVTRRTVAKYREDLRIPSTHQRRIKK